MTTTPIVAIINGKGGTGKTSITANLSGLLAAAERRVLAIDLDPQGNLALDLGLAGAGLSDNGASLVAAGMSGSALTPVPNVRPGLDVIPGGAALNDLAAVLTSRRAMPAATSTRPVPELIRDLAGGYDIVFIDCPPGVEVLQEVALKAANYVLTPVKTDDASRTGLGVVASRFESVQNENLRFLGAVLFGVNRQATRTLDAARTRLVEDLEDSEAVFTATIRHVEAAATQARHRGQLAHELEAAAGSQDPWWKGLRGTDPNGASRQDRIPGSAGPLAEDYFALAEELLHRIAALDSMEVPA